MFNMQTARCSELSSWLTKGKKGSAIWLLCTEDPEDESKVQCNHCGIVLNKGGTCKRSYDTTNRFL